MRINRKIVLGILLILALPILAIGLFTYFRAADVLTERALAHLASVAAIQKKRVESLLARDLERLSLVSSRTQLRLSLAAFLEKPRPEDAEKISRMLADTRSAIGTFEDVHVLALDGKAVASTDAAAVGSDHSGDAAFRKGMRESCVDTCFLDERQRLRTWLAGPLRLDGRPIGVVLIVSRADTLISLARDYSGLGETGETVLARKDENGDAIFLTPLRFDENAALRRRVAEDERCVPILHALSGKAELFSDAVDYRGEPVLAATQYLREPGWGLVVKMDTAEALAPIARLRRLLALAALCSAAAVFVIYLWLSRAITRPLINLKRAASRIGGGDLSLRVEAETDDEIGELAHAFNEAAQKLEASRTSLLGEVEERKRMEQELWRGNRALKTLNESSVLLASASDEPDLLQRICEIVVKVGGYRLAWIGLAEHDGARSVRPVAQAGYEEGYVETVNITWADTERGRGPTGTAIRTGEPSAARNILVDPRFSPWREEATKRGYASSLALPLTASGEAFGALNIYAAEPEAFDEKEVELLTKLANNLSYGVVNLRARTDGKLAAEALRISEASYRILFDAAPVGIGMAELDGRPFAANRKMEEITGYTLDEIRHVNLADTYVDPADRMRLLESLRQSGRVGNLEARLRRKDGTVYHALLNVDVVKLGDKEALLTTVRDISRRKQLEEQLLQSQKMEAIGRLAGGIAHDFNNMMQVVTGFAVRTLRDLGPDDPHRKDVEEIRKAGERATVLTRQLVAVGRKQILQYEVLDLNSVVSECEAVFQRALGEDVDLVTELQPDLGRVKADRAQMEQVVMNLAINARDAMPEGGRLTIETANAELGEEHPHDDAAVPPGPYAMLAVSDTGCGMDTETLSHAFEPFFTTKAPGEGTGLGLSTAYGTIHQSGGVIRAYSEPGKGSTFKIYLPRVDQAVEPEREKTSGAAPRGTETILLVEDDQVVRDLTALELQELGYNVLVTQNAGEALQSSQQHAGRIHLMLTDVVLPVVSGPTIFETIVRERSDTKVLYMSGHAAKHIVSRGVLNPGTVLLEKPFLPEELARKVREVLDSSPAAD